MSVISSVFCYRNHVEVFESSADISLAYFGLARAEKEYSLWKKTKGPFLFFSFLFFSSFSKDMVDIITLVIHPYINPLPRRPDSLVGLGWAVSGCGGFGAGFLQCIVHCDGMDGDGWMDSSEVTTFEYVGRGAFFSWDSEGRKRRSLRSSA